MKAIDEIRKNLGSKNMLIGERETMKAALMGKIKKVFIAKNCKADVKKDLSRAQGISGFELVELEIANEELGTLCKKPFAVSVIGVTA
ncbi:MAG: ribosomal L7Ae/L30e/S12e/Gadd45 family protein [Nanoarchaeota archaeon]